MIVQVRRLDWSPTLYSLNKMDFIMDDALISGLHE
jgi:hypothetical protein